MGVVVFQLLPGMPLMAWLCLPLVVAAPAILRMCAVVVAVVVRDEDDDTVQERADERGSMNRALLLIDRNAENLDDSIERPLIPG